MASRLLEEATSISAEILNPFIHKLELTTYDKIKVVVMTVTVLPIRLILMLTLLTSAWLLAVVGRLGLSSEDMKEKPMSGWRRHYLKPFICFVLRVMFLFGGWHWITIKGKQASPKEAPILTMAPHSSLFDVLPVILLGGPSVVAKADTARTPFFGTLINYTQPVYVKRNDPMSRQNTIQEIKKRAQSEEDWQQIVIFPEGTCTNRKCLINFKPGAFYPGVPVQPVCIKYANRMDTMTWTWEGPGAWKLLWLTLCQFQNYCEIEYLPVYTPSEMEMHNPKLFARNVKLIMAKSLDIPVSYYAYDDLRFIQWCGENNLPQTPSVVKFVKLRHRQGREKCDVTDEVDILQKRLTSDNLFYTIYELANFIDSASTDTLRDVFDAMDQESEGRIDARIYIGSLLLLKFDITLLERIEQIFKMFANQNNLVDLKPFCSLAWLMLGITTTSANSLFQKLDGDNQGAVSYQEFKQCLSETPLQLSIPKECKNKPDKCTRPNESIVTSIKTKVD